MVEKLKRPLTLRQNLMSDNESPLANPASSNNNQWDWEMRYNFSRALNRERRGNESSGIGCLTSISRGFQTMPASVEHLFCHATQYDMVQYVVPQPPIDPLLQASIVAR